ncbi:MAG: DmsE family decaheme c-type cytochrome [Deltaproteobacteria bacterium]|nr:DmsE family decaheme c-type cytochrome [Deltaproteobacteria bacterium]
MRKNILMLSLVAGIVALSGAGMSANSAKAAAPASGAESCKDCHADQVASFMKSRHAKGAVTGPNGTGVCLTCHGPNLTAHVAAGGGKGTGAFTFDKKADAEARAEKCLTCHGDSKHLALWESSKHRSSGLSCDSCHSGHSSLAKNLKMPQVELCFSCHKDVKAEAGRQSHHPIKEGKVSCSDCHDPHGSFNAKNLKADSVNELCYKCHAEKRGPFMNEHPPVAQDCLICHTSHGSNHNKLLNERTPSLCQTCHVGTSGHYGTPFTLARGFTPNTPTTVGTNYSSGRAVARSCLNCHAAIHGSNGPGVYGQRFAK